MGAGAGELDRIMGGDCLARPCPVRGRGGRWQRDPAPEWDWWYESVDVTERRRLGRFMGADGVGPDQVAAWLYTDVDSAMEAWRTAARLELEGMGGDDECEGWQEADQLRALEQSLVGPQEIAAAVGCSAALVHQWRKRGKLPPADLVISNVPIWRWLSVAHLLVSDGSES